MDAFMWARGISNTLAILAAVFMIGMILLQDGKGSVAAWAPVGVEGTSSPARKYTGFAAAGFFTFLIVHGLIQ